MKRLAVTLATVSTVVLGSAGLAPADESAELVIDGEIEIVTRAAAPDHVEGLDEIMSGWVFRSDETQALQMDDFENPGMVFVDKARETSGTRSRGVKESPARRATARQRRAWRACAR